ncbi:MAG: hypothetical protein ACE5KI_06430 [Dehalococcoidia bacterium]
MTEDEEIKAMVAVNQALNNLDEAVVERVLRWAADRFKVNSLVATSSKRGGASGEEGDVADFYDRTNPSTDAERALVVGYWFQEVQGDQDLDAQKINTELKHLGHGVGNITTALNDLIDRTPNLVIQTRKSGTTKQARKKYRLTVEGIRRVNEMLAGKTARNE